MAKTKPKQFVTYKLKIECNTPYPILLTDTSFSTIESMDFSCYLMYKKKIYNMDTKRFSKISSKSN